jgi:hypothetical protein
MISEELLPEWCYSMKENGEIITIHRGEKGYYDTDLPKHQDVDRMNKRRGISREQRQAMEIGCVMGFENVNPGLVQQLGGTHGII